MDLHDPAPTSEIRREALTAAHNAFHRVLLEHDVRLDLFTRLEQIDLAMDELEAEMSRQLETVQ